MEHLSKSMEKYLFKMYELLKEDKLTPKKLAAALNCNRASTQEAIKHLEAKGLIDFYPYKFILLTDEGVKYAKKIEEKKEIISKFLEKFLFIEKKNFYFSPHCVHADIRQYDSLCRQQRHIIR